MEPFLVIRGYRRAEHGLIERLLLHRRPHNAPNLRYNVLPLTVELAVRTHADSQMVLGAEPESPGGRTEHVLLRVFITALQRCCLHDAASGRTLAPTRSQQHVWEETEDGAILHSEHVLAALHRYGFVDRVSRGRYVASKMTHRALRLPVRSG
jgi:hypothetical protein